MTHPALSQLKHRPWGIPNRPWTWRQSWHDLLFAHWPVPLEALRPLIPRQLELQEFGGSCWIGVVPFRMTGVMRRPLPDLPWLSAFPELNVRTYVQLDGKPGVWFLSLDASNAIAVWAARRFFHLPYHRAQMTFTVERAGIRYRSVRSDAKFLATYRPTSDVYYATPGSHEHWLTERYCLYASAPDGSLWRNDVHHHPWPLQEAAWSLEENTMLDSHGVALPLTPPILHFAKQVDVVVWNADRVGS